MLIPVEIAGITVISVAIFVLTIIALVSHQNFEKSYIDIFILY